MRPFEKSAPSNITAIDTPEFAFKQDRAQEVLVRAPLFFINA